MTSEARAMEPDQLEAEYLERKAQLRTDASLSWEQKELQVKRLGDEHYRVRKEKETA